MSKLSMFAFSVICLGSIQNLDAQGIVASENGRSSAPDTSVGDIQHIIWVWFENREVTAVTTPYFFAFASNNVNFTNFYGVSHPSQPNYLDAWSGSNHGITDDSYCTFPASTDSLAKQMATAGKSWRVYAQDYPGNCSDVTSFTGGVDGPGVAGQYARKHNPAIGFESVRLDSTQCSYIQRLANFDPLVNLAFVVPNLINDMHDGTTAQGDAFLQAFVPLVTASPDWAHTLLIVTFDEGTTSVSGGGHIYTAAAAPWLTHANVSTTYNHFSVLRTIEQIFGLPFLGSAASATTMSELFPSGSTPTPAPSATPTATATVSPTASPTPTLTPAQTATPSTTPSPTPSSTPNGTPSPTPTPIDSAQAINLSTRLLVQSGDNVGIAGFIVAGSVPKQVLLRGIGPSLGAIGIANPLADPILELHGPTGFDTVTNDNWRDSQEVAIQATGIPPTNNAESAILATLNAGAYTAIIRGANNSSGIALIEAYDLNPTGASKLNNISTRAFVDVGNGLVVAGFILGNQSGSDRIVVRGLGPSLAALGVPNSLVNPTLQVRNSDGAIVGGDDDWQDYPPQALDLTALGLAPTDPLESAILMTLSPGSYTALLSGVSQGVGVGLVEVYDNVGGAP